MAKFSQIPWFVIKQYCDEVVQDYPDMDYPSQEGNGILFTDNSSFVTKNTNPFELYSKSPGENYKELKGTINSEWNGNDVLRLKRLFTREIIPSDDVLRIENESGYERTTYDAFSDEYQYDIENGDEIYVRKDSLFTNWFNQYEELEEYFNSNKIFTFLGYGYKEDEYLKIFHYALKNWIMDAIPENNRNDTLNKFFHILYDKLQHRVYEMQRDIWSLLDPYEIDEEKLGNLSTVYFEEPLSTSINTFKRRVYADNLINWLKKKGTYSSIFILWYMLTKDTNNMLKIYDRWHTKLPSGSPEEYFDDYEYTKFYTGSTSADYPQEYTSDYVLSTHYKIEMGIDSNPFSENSILPMDLITDLYNKCEKIRPVTRFSHYTIPINIKSDFSGNSIPFYEDPLYDVNIYSKSTLFTETTSGASLHVQTDSTSIWTIDHNLESKNILTHVYNLDLVRILPNDIEIINNSRIRVYFDEPVSGSAFLVLSDYVRSNDFVLNDWTITHLLNSKYVLSQMYETTEINEYNMIPYEATAVDGDILNVRTLGVSGYGLIASPNYTHTQFSPSTEWSIEHNLGYIGVLVDIYDENDEKIYPKSITCNTTEECTVTFSSPVSGHCSIRAAGNPSLGGDIINKFTDSFDIKIGNGEDLDNWNYTDQNDIKNTIHIITCDESYFKKTDYGVKFTFTIPKKVEGWITEIGIFNNEDDLSWITTLDYFYKHPEFEIEIVYDAFNENIL